MFRIITRIVKVVVFCSVTIAFMVVMEPYFLKEDIGSESAGRVLTFRRQPSDMVDVALLGTSAVYRGWSSVDAYHTGGFTSWDRSTPSQPVQATKYVIKDILKTHTPELFVINYTRFRLPEIRKTTEGNLRAVTDNLIPSLNRWEAVQALMPLCADESIDPLNFALPFFRFHGEWIQALEKVLSGDPPIKDSAETMGTLVQKLYFRKNPIEIGYEETDVKAEFSEEATNEIEELLTWLQEEEIPVLFVLLPRGMDQVTAERFNTVEALFDEYGFDYFNLTKQTDEMGINNEEDLRDESHLNHWGREKTTKYLATYLAENYELPDHRDDPAYDAWDVAYEEYLSQIAPHLERIEEGAAKAAENKTAE